MDSQRYVAAEGYRGADRRVDQPDFCFCYGEHSQMLRADELDIRSLESDMKAKVSSKLFITCVIIFVGMSGFIYDRLHSVDRQVAEVLTRQEAFRENLQGLKQDLQSLVREFRAEIREDEQRRQSQ